MLIATVPYCEEGKGFPPGKDLGMACNQFFAAYLHNDDWGLILDHDLTIVTPNWREIVEKAIENYPTAGCFTFKLNKAARKSVWQVAPGVDTHRDDLPYHEEVAIRELTCVHPVIDVTENEKLPGGFALSGLMVIKKTTWKSVGGFPTGEKFVDWGMHAKVRKHGLKVYLLPQVYVYHWGRGQRY